MEKKITFRDSVVPADVLIVADIVKSTNFFNHEEEEMAVELVKDRLNEGIACGYYFIFAEIEGRPIAYSCYGPISGTKDSYDFYWLATLNNLRGQGIGKLLLAETEKAIKKAGGNGIYIETASKPLYNPTRKFYENSNYILEAQLKDFYGPNDDKCIYVKRVG